MNKGCESSSGGCAVVEEFRRVRAEVLALRQTLQGVEEFLEHVWRDVQMNEYSSDLLHTQMDAVRRALGK
jgi:hypothetical protein